MGGREMNRVWVFLSPEGQPAGCFGVAGRKPLPNGALGAADLTETAEHTRVAVHRPTLPPRSFQGILSACGTHSDSYGVEVWSAGHSLSNER